MHPLLQYKQLIDTLRLNDAADWGMAAFRHALQNLHTPARYALDLEGVFQGIPAVIIGAGPSPQVPDLRESAIVFAGGSALETIPFAPHFACCIDPHKILELRHPNTPLCFQARMKPENRASQEALLAPDSHFPFLNELAGEKRRLDSGWTVGNFMAALALHFGCDPIVSIGANHIREDGSQPPDWVAASLWMQQFDIQSVKSFIPVKIPQIQERVDQAICAASWVRPQIAEWKESLRVCDDRVFEHLLRPLWEIWESVFPGDKELHRRIFFQNVLQEHRHAIGVLE
jgi:hypothetical protein